MILSRTPVQGLTIDGPTSRDLDDAIWVEEDPAGWTVTVSIAAVASAIRPRSGLDKAARAKVATSYLARGNVPMLPRSISEGWLSLLPGRRRRTLSLVARVTTDLEVENVQVLRSRLVSAAQLSYEQIPGILATPEHPQHAVIVASNRLSRALLTQRRRAGALALYDLNAGLLTTEEGQVVNVQRAWINGQSLIAEMMILANRLFADYAIAGEIPLLFRNHTARAHAPARDELLAELAGLVGATEGEATLLRERTHRTLNRADYGPTLRGHYGLALPAYLHGTSPIRRYADLIVHRQIEAHLAGEPFPHSRDELAEMAVEINGRIAAQREAVEAHHRARAYAPVERALDHGRPLHHLAPSDLEKAVKLALDVPCPPLLRDALLGRLRGAEALPPLLTALVFLGASTEAGWGDVRRALLARLVIHPAEAKSALAIAKDRGLLTALAFEEDPAGAPGGLFLVHAKAQLPEGAPLTATWWPGATAKKVAEQRSAVTLLAKVANLPAPVFPRDAPMPLSVATTARTPTASATDNPVGHLIEMAAQRAEPQPTFHEVANGTPHAPMFTVTARFRGITATGKASTKKAAKTMAARGILRQLG